MPRSIKPTFSTAFVFAPALLVGLSAVLMPAGAQVKAATLVKNGAEPAPVVLFENAPPKTREAAVELTEYIEKISGAKPELIEGAPGNTPDRAIWVGFQPQVAELFPDIDFEFEHAEQIVLAANANHVVVAGRDRWDEDHLIVEGRNGTIEGRQQEYGTANAVYTFLERNLGVRWLWPGPTGEDVIEKQTITLEPFTYRYHPQVRERSGLFRLSELADGRGVAHDWVRHQRLQLDSFMSTGGHAFTDWWDRFHEEHPDYFALQPDGTRSGFPSPHKVKLCLSNPKVWDQWIKHVEEVLEERPNQTLFNASPNDSHHRGICICENCRAWDHPDGAPKHYVWQGVGQEYVAMSDRYVTFANRLGEKLKERFPDRDYYVLMMAYGSSQPPPAEAVPADNVIISHVGHMPWQESMREKELAQWKQWADIAPHLMQRPNTGSPAGWQWGMPEVLTERTAHDFKFLAQHQWAGVFVDTVWEHWSTQAPQYYLMGQLTWNPDKDRETVMNDYYERGFGPASEHIKAYWTLLENTRNKLVDDEKASRFDLHKFYTDEVLDRAAALLDKAEATLANAPDKYKPRLKLVRQGFTWTRLTVENRKLTAQVEETRDRDSEAANQVRDNWETLRELSEQNPLIVNYMFLRSPHGNSRARGLHPDNFAN